MLVRPLGGPLGPYHTLLIRYTQLDVIRPRHLTLAALLGATVAFAQMGPPRPFSTPEVKLIEAGSEPRQKLRYDNAKDAGIDKLETFDVAAGGWWSIQMPDNSAMRVFPIIQTPIKAARGVTGIGVEFLAPTTVEVRDGGFPDPGMLEVLKGLDGVAGWVPTDDHGAPTGLALHPGPKDTKFAANKRDIEMRSAMGIEVARGLLTRLTVPFPLEPLGKHARWDVRRYVNRGQVQYEEIAHFELIDFSKGIATVTMKFGGAQLADGPYRAGELDLFVDGTGEAKVDLRRPLPLSWSDSVDINATMHSLNGLKAQHKGHLTTREQMR